MLHLAVAEAQVPHDDAGGWIADCLGHKLCNFRNVGFEVMKIFRRFNDVGVTVLIASHDIALIDHLGCRQIALENGRLKQVDTSWV